MANLGNLLLWLTLFAAGASVIALFVGRSQGEKDGEGATNAGYMLTFGVFGTLTVATGILMAAFLTNSR